MGYNALNYFLGKKGMEAGTSSLMGPGDVSRNKHQRCNDV
jgi:hypothetical protein